MTFLDKIKMLFLEEVEEAPKKDLSSIKDKFERVCTNAHDAMGTYKKKEFKEWANEAIAKGEPYFYTEPIDPKNPFKVRLCEPKYEYRLKDGLTPEEFNELFS